MRRDFFGLMLTLTDNNLILLSSTDAKHSYKYMFVSNQIFAFFLQFLALNSLTSQTALNEFTLNEHLITNVESLMAFFLSYYFILSKLNLRLCLGTWVNKESLVASSVKLFSNISWPEREVAEMYGVHFIEKSDSRHLLLDYNFIYFPMLSTFPPSGYQEVIYNFIKKLLEYAHYGYWEGIFNSIRAI